VSDENLPPDPPTDDSPRRRAGLSYAPPYDPSKEMDPTSAPVIETPKQVRREDFDFFRKRIALQAFYGRLLIFTLLFVAMLVNIVLTLQSKDDIILNINETRAHASTFEDGVQRELLHLHKKVDELEAEVRTLSEAAAKAE